MDKKDEGKAGTAPAGPSSNWAKLQKMLPKDQPKAKGKMPIADPNSGRQRKKAMYAGVGRYMSRSDITTSNGDDVASQPIAGPSKVTIPTTAAAHVKEDVILLESPSDKPLVEELRQMVAGRAVLNEAKKAPGNYLAIDCEMVGCGHLGSESALARVSLVNYHGQIILDTFVQPRERVTDWRTWISGVRERDVVVAPEFEDVQKDVARIIEGKVLVGHAIDNDLKVLLLSHPSPLIRDTQKCKPLREKAKNKHPGLKRLAEMELGIQIQKAAHSSVTDARATMALYRLHKGEWESQLRHTTEAYRQKTGHGPTNGKDKRAATVSLDVDEGGSTNGKRKRGDDNDDDDNNEESPELTGTGKKTKKGKGKEIQQFPGGGRKGISSGLGLIVRRFGQRVDGGRDRSGDGGRGRGSRRHTSSSGGGGKWWEENAQ